ncbi:MAG: TonB-dependent receptor, partial [Emcibacter sp.]|nr:TonB-dependent receptor [Emcibacter sp.]
LRQTSWIRLFSGNYAFPAHHLQSAQKPQREARYDRTVFARDENYWQLSEELRLTSPSGEKIEYLAGIFYYKSNWESVDIQDWGTPAFPSPPSPISGQLFNGGFSNNFSQKTETISIFGQLTWNISDVLRATGGLRYTDEQKDILYGRVNFAPLTIWNTVANPPFPITPLEFSDSFVNGNINVQYDVNADVMVYASFGHGTKTGGYVETNTVPTANPLVEAFVDSETAKSYEIGTKMSLLENTANLNISVFYTTVDNFQETTFTGVAFVTDNIPLETKGIEVEAAWMATDNFRFNGALTYADARERNTGLHPAQAPLWTGYMGVTYEQDVSDNLAVRINGTVRHRSEMYNQKGHVLPSDAYTTLDASIALLDVSDLWEVKIVGRNLTNAITADFGSPNPDPTFASAEGPAQLRTIKLLFSYNF